MHVTIAPWSGDDLETARNLIREGAIAPQFDNKLGPGDLERWLADPYCREEVRFLARVDGRAVGFAFGFVLPGEPSAWAMLRIGVTESFRRRGVASRLLATQLERLPAIAPECREVALAAWEPCEPATRFAAARGFVFARHFWRMERAPEGLREPDWPAGVTTRAFDGSDLALAEWSAIHNDSFAQHYRFVRSSVASCRAIAEAPNFHRDAVRLAYADEQCVGYCRNDVSQAGGEIATLGVAHAFQGKGLGRALLRWGAGWLAKRGALPIALLVDGENETALRLYRSEGFRVTRTRTLWAKPLAPSSAG